MLSLIDRGIGVTALYRCECGTDVRLFVSNVNGGHTKSCGCLRNKERAGPSRTYAACTNRVIEHEGEALTLVEWSERSGVKYHTLMARIDRGVPMALALSTPRYLSLGRIA